MAFKLLNGYDVEVASSKYVYENLIPAVQHINGKGCSDKWTLPEDIESVNQIDVIRVLPYAPFFRQLGAANNGSYHNQSNEGGYNNAPQSEHYSVPVDLYYDRGVPITSVQQYSNKIMLQQVIMAGIIDSASLAINVITYAKQIEGYFANGENFDKAKTHAKGAIVAGDVTAAEIADAAFFYDPAETGTSANSPAMAFLNANASLSEGIPEIGAMYVPADARQGFVTTKFNVLLRSQYMQNASDVSARILATGFINPFTQTEDKRVDARTGICGMYDGVDLVMFNGATKNFVYIALGVLGTADDTNEDLVACRAALDKIGAIVVYGAGTSRGVVGPVIDANPNTYFGGVYILPRMKCGVKVFSGRTIKMVVNAGTNLATAWTAADIAKLMNKLTFTPIDGKVITGAGTAAMVGFNTGTTN